jgi:Na+-transporting NADH:ubiquinone oxidoreductase subunit F
METVLYGVVAFTLVILALVLILMVAKARLVASGDVKILINDDPSKAVTAPAGSTLLSTLAAARAPAASAASRSTPAAARSCRPKRATSTAARSARAIASPARSRSSRTS